MIHYEFIYIADVDDTFIDLIAPAGEYELEVGSKQPEVILKLRYLSHPPIETMMWRDVHGIEIPWITDPNQGLYSKFDARREDQRITLTIRHLSVADAGEYTLYANNGKMETERKIALRVKGNLL